MSAAATEDLFYSRTLHAKTTVEVNKARAEHQVTVCWNTHVTVVTANKWQSRGCHARATPGSRKVGTYTRSGVDDGE